MKRLPLVLLILVLATPAAAGVDPTRPPVATPSASKPAPARKALSLSAILWASDRHLAVINGMPRAVGERFDGMVLEHVTPERALVRDRWGVRTLHLHPDTIKIPARSLPARETDG